MVSRYAINNKEKKGGDNISKKKSNPFDALLSLSDAAKKWGKDDSTLRHSINRGKFVADIDAKLFGKQWVITEEAMRREYGDPIE